jgi:SAM-dependent methyltransferase
VKFQIDDRAEKYLRVQCGDIDNKWHADDPDRTAWRAAYDERIERVFESMKPALPETCRSLLDIGGGLSGIGARLNKHYGGNVRVCVLDGKNALAYVDRHNQPFNNATVTQTFLRANGVRNQDFYSPDDEINEPFDLIVSSQAWCFHIAPCVYLDMVKRTLRPGGTFIADFRRGHPEWVVQVVEALAPGPPAMGGTLASAAKWHRLYIKRDQHAI